MKVVREGEGARASRGAGVGVGEEGERRRWARLGAFRAGHPVRGADVSWARPWKEGKENQIEKKKNGVGTLSAQ